ncbi:peptidase M56 [Bacillus cereus]|uniref:M56 family metallopeptidase n=1 Tax=Bacillus cereus TaxID=1396 RepID=UPI001D13C0EA|nr:M56 family metallopeptidase [Bacillus cereus]MCC3689415.1 peptidase M56 [Bacillus cereus]
MFYALWNVYLSTIFNWIIETSILASMLVVFILCIRTFFKNWLTPRWQYALWVILIVRLMLPYFPESSFSVYPILSKGFESAQFIIQKNTKKLDLIENVNTTKTDVVSVENNEQYHIEDDQNNQSASIYNILLTIWFLGVLLFGFFVILANKRLYSYIGNQPIIKEKRILDILETCRNNMLIQREIPIVLSGKISSPTLLGIRSPRILLDKNQIKSLKDDQLKYIFYHELSHYKRKDISINLLMNVLLILNWFNPILWYAYHKMREDQELACDALALTFIDHKENIAYGQTIITLLEGYSMYYKMSTLANFSKNKSVLKRRIIMIKKFNKKSYRWSAIGLSAILGVTAFSFVNVTAEAAPYKKNIEQVKKQEEAKKAEEMSKKQEENKMRKQEEAKKAEEMSKKQEENKMRKQEEAKKAEEMSKKQEEENKMRKQEEENKMRKQEEENKMKQQEEAKRMAEKN